MYSVFRSRFLVAVLALILGWSSAIATPPTIVSVEGRVWTPEMQPAAAHEVQFTLLGEEHLAASVVTDARGHFEARVPSGEYVLAVLDGDKPLAAAPIVARQSQPPVSVILPSAPAAQEGSRVRVWVRTTGGTLIVVVLAAALVYAGVSSATDDEDEPPVSPVE